jgi:hypothetical protein
MKEKGRETVKNRLKSDKSFSELFRSDGCFYCENHLNNEKLSSFPSHISPIFHRFKETPVWNESCVLSRQEAIPLFPATERSDHHEKGSIHHSSFISSPVHSGLRRNVMRWISHRVLTEG